MKHYNKDIGTYGEKLALKHLTDKGYKIIEMNYRNRYGELDIVSFYNNLIVFVEVKSRYTNSFGLPMESVT